MAIKPHRPINEIAGSEGRQRKIVIIYHRHE
jgi:hypothetical protein